MSSFQSLPGFRSQSLSNKISKPKNKTVVKPILKKLSQSEKSSLDLDRGWADQDEQYRNDIWGGEASFSTYEQPIGARRSTKETNLTFNEVVTTRRYNHSRSISGASHISVATSSNSSSGHRQAGTTFVHPFQQIPRTSTPPLYSNSLTSIGDSRDYSPTITEDDDTDNNNVNANVDVDVNPAHTHSHNSLHIHLHQNPQSHSHLHQHHHNRNHNHKPINPHSHSQPSLTTLSRPALATSQRTSSFSDVNNARTPSLRINTSRAVSTTPTQSPRLVNIPSRSNLHVDRALESPTSPITNIGSNHISSPTSSVAPMSPLRSSLDSAGFRLRSKSDLDTATRADHLREARRKFELREKAKDEKFAREQIKRRERADNKRAHELEKQAAAIHKEQLAAKARQDAIELEEAIARGKQARKISMQSSGRPSVAMSRPSTSRKNTATSPLGDTEKFMSSNYDSMGSRYPPSFGNEAGGASDVHFRSFKRRNTAKKKTQSAWTSFILWLRTRLLRAGTARS
ncbi:hypothetical protein F4779DRAFT_495764 [Xylariaceae sp. FL0662B]|nr:hypothetical protein F4779DRAFT_495764 [Xylariaceae sp. FL0662B]